MSKTPESGTDVDWQSLKRHLSHESDHNLQPLHYQHGKDDQSKPRSHKRALFILIAYIPFITIPWALTCVMAKRPLSLWSFDVQSGLSKEDITRIDGWMTAINVANSIASVITIPVLSALIAQAAAVYTQRNKNDQSLHLNHLVALADRGWTSPSTLSRSWSWRQHGSTGVRSFLYLAALIILLGMFVKPDA
jgi:hypothetical protein